jgi:hypothetical protein
MEQTASTYGGQLRIYSISSRRQPTTGGPPAWGLGVELQHLTLKSACYEMSQWPWTWTDSLDDRPKLKENGHEIWLSGM